MPRCLVLIVAAAAALFFAGCRAVKPPAQPGVPALEPSDRFVRIKEIDGKFWFVHGDRQFLSLGVNAVVPVDGSNPRDPERYNVLPKYNSNTVDWAQATLTRLWKWKFTTAACWSHEAMYTNTSMYHTRILDLGEWGRNDSRLIDVWSGYYMKSLDEAAQKRVLPHAENTKLIGYFINNELPWYGERGWPTSPKVSLLSRYMKLQKDAPGKVRAIEFLKGYYKEDFAAFQKEWITKAASFDELRVNSDIEPRIPSSRRAVALWAGIVAEQYFKLCAETIRKYDKNHLLLGVRFAQRAYVPVMEACGRYCDVVSVNHYSKSGEFNEQMVGAIAALTKRPILITEFSWRAMENRSKLTNDKGADVTVKTQKDRGAAFRRYATEALQQPYLVGYDWFLYADQPPMGRSFDGENSNYGLVDIKDEPYEELVKEIRDINAQAVTLHASSTVAAPAYNPEILADYRDVSVRGSDTRLPAPKVFVDSTSARHAYGDFATGASVEDNVTRDKYVAITFNAGRGWGCGISFKPATNCPANADGSAKLLGASRIRMRMRADTDVVFFPALNESGHGTTDKQAFDGFQHSDGESYNHSPVQGQGGWHEYVFELTHFERTPHYGNQRGNNVIDMHAIAEVCLNFTEPKKASTIQIAWIKFE
jgi:hypothetical protein